MPYRQVTFDPPLLVELGDRFAIDHANDKVLQIRAGVVIDERAIDLPGTFLGDTPPAIQTGDFSVLLFFERNQMAGSIVTLTNVTLGAGDVVYADFSNGDQSETSIADMESKRAGLNGNVSLLKDLLLAKLIELEPTLENADRLNGSSASIDMSAATPVVMTLTE